MKRNVVFQALAPIVITLVFLMPIRNTLAQTPTQAAMDAKQDAERYNAVPWLIMGGLTVQLPICLSFVGSNKFLSNATWVVPVIAAITLPDVIKVSPPTQRLMGKSADYVSEYVRTYEDLVRHKRRMYGTYGCLTAGCFVGCLVGGVLILDEGLNNAAAVVGEALDPLN